MPFHQLMNKTYQAKTTQNSHIINEGDKFNEYIKTYCSQHSHDKVRLFHAT